MGPLVGQRQPLQMLGEDLGLGPVVSVIGLPGHLGLLADLGHGDLLKGVGGHPLQQTLGEQAAGLGFSLGCHVTHPSNLSHFFPRP